MLGADFVPSKSKSRDQIMWSHLNLFPAVEPRRVDPGHQDLQPLGDLARAPAHTQHADLARVRHAVLFPV